LSDPALRHDGSAGLAISGDSAHSAIMSDDSAELHVKVRHRNRPPKPYKWEIYRGNDPICINRAMHGYPTQQAADNAGEKALRRFLESEALKQEQGIMANKHSRPPEPPNDNAKSIDRWDDEGGAPSGGRSVRKRPRRDNVINELRRRVSTLEKKPKTLVKR
jgi:hypothetical protein